MINYLVLVENALAPNPNGYVAFVYFVPLFFLAGYLTNCNEAKRLGAKRIYLSPQPERLNSPLSVASSLRQASTPPPTPPHKGGVPPLSCGEGSGERSERTFLPPIASLHWGLLTFISFGDSLSILYNLLLQRTLSTFNSQLSTIYSNSLPPKQFNKIRSQDLS